ncbi:MAG TPA: M20/M25/M40 family metallo-hydrolase [Planctomycetota bacterium]|nr:M20/M25/M40 family metallo-hydrolase [Planctomycetota bacterium]
MPLDWLQVARDLIAIESITGNEEPAVAYIEARLRDLGLAVRSDEVLPGRRNLYAGPEQPTVVLCTHTDTVPPYVPLREDDEWLYGRGACDTKGITAAFLAAGERLLARGVDDVGFLFVVGEEVDNAGARRANEWLRARYILVGEPTENRLAQGHKGILVARLLATGEACHSAYPELGSSATHRLIAAAARLLATDFGHDPVLGQATLNVGTIEGGVAANVLAPSAEARVALRVVTSIDDAENKLFAALEASQGATAANAASLAVEILVRMPPAWLATIEGFPTTVVRYGTDVPFLANVGTPLLYGPGSIHHAHTLDERIEKRSIEQAIDDIVAIVGRLREGRGIRSPRSGV